MTGQLCHSALFAPRTCPVRVSPCNSPRAAFLQTPVLIRGASPFKSKAATRSLCIRRAQHCRVLVCANQTTPSLQLATAKLPSQCDEDLFSSSLYQWAATITHSGQNMPFALPFRTDPLPNGFQAPVHRLQKHVQKDVPAQLSLLRIGAGGRPMSVGDLRATVEPEPGAGKDRVLFVRFFEGEGSFMDRQTPPNFRSDQERLKAALANLVDIPILMQTLPNAIRAAVVKSRT